LPQRHAVNGDPYPDQCLATAKALSAAMRWTGPTTVTFQSRFGREEWLRPYTDEILRGLAAERLGRLVALCPGFTTDCLETLEEMGITNRELYQNSGGGAYRLLPCLNTDAQWIDAMTTIVSREMSGWLGEN
jgi:protoporphyrin/coproporphyrin ferrochelatase